MINYFRVPSASYKKNRHGFIRSIINYVSCVPSRLKMMVRSSDLFEESGFEG